jgi:iron complex outermembrane receptor protein
MQCGLEQHCSEALSDVLVARRYCGYRVTARQATRRNVVERAISVRLDCAQPAKHRRECAIRRGLSIAAIVTICALSHTICVTSAVAAEQLSFFDIPAGPADLSLRKFVLQAGLSVIYEPGRLKRFKTRALEGKYEPTEALQKLLEGSGLECTFTTSRMITVSPRPVPVAPGLEGQDLPVINIAGWTTDGLYPFPAGVSIQRITGEELSREGFATVPDWVQTLTQNQGSGATEDTRSYLREAPTNTAYGSGINLYGIGQRATLVLVNGRRLAPSGSAGSFTDVLNIPISAIDHIDLISDGASTIYGADAIGGIVNFVLRGGFSTPLSTVSIGHLTRGSLGEEQFSQSLSAQSDHGGALVSLEYYSRDALPASERMQATSDLTPWGGTNFDDLAGNPATILDSKGRLWGVPAGQNGTSLTPAELLPKPNQYDRDANTWILPHQERLSALVSATYQVSDDSSVFFDALLSQRRIDIQDAPLTAVLSVPGTNPFYVNPVAGNRNPVTVLYGFGSDFGPITEQGRVNSGQLALGLNHELSETWNFRGYVGHTYEDQRDVEHNLVNFGVLTEYLAKADATAFNPFGDGSSTDPKTLAAIRTDGRLAYNSALTYVNLSTAGSLPLLPAGPITVTMGYDYRVQSFESSLIPISSFEGQTPDTNRDRTVSALFVQNSIPVFGAGFPARWPLKLELAGGVRYEHFSDAKSAVTPSLGFDFQPATGLSLKGTWTRLFRPPNLPDLNESVNISEVFALADPTSSSGHTKTLVWTGNNANLTPETAHSWTVGLTFSPPGRPDFSLDTQYFNIVSSHRIPPVQLLPFTLFSDPQYSYLFTRNVTPSALANVCSRSQFIGSPDQCQSSDIGAIVDLRLRNLETLETDGFDLSGSYARETPIGTFGTNLQATYILHFKEAEIPDTPLVSYRNTAHNPTALRLRGLLRWENRGFSVSPAINLQSSYTDTDSLPSRPVGAWMTWDLVLGYGMRPLDRRLGGETTLSLRGFNVFNKQPPFLNNSVGYIGYDPENGDLLGRRISLAIEHKW